MLEVIRSTLVRGAVIIVVGMSCVTPNKALAQRSVRQLVVDAGAIIRQIEDAKRLASCIKIDDRDQLIGGGNFWLEKVEVSIHARDPQLLNLMSVLRPLIVDIEAMPPCVSPASKDAKTDTLLSDDPSSPPVLLGSNAGEFVTDAKDGIFIGTSTGREARASDYATVVGHIAGYNLKASPNTVLLGRATAQWLESSPSAVAIGSSAARKARNADHTIFVGSSAGYGAQNVDFSLLLGYAAGRWIKNNNYSLISGYAAGEYADYAHHSVMTGAFAG